MKIITDTGALLSPKEGEKIGVDVLPLNVIADKKSYKEYVDVTSQEFLDIVKEGHVPSSSQPSIGETMELFEKYPNIKYAASTKRVVNSVNNNSLQGFLFDKDTLHKSRTHTFDILDRVGGGDSFTAGILHGILNNMESSQTVEFATCASALKHSIRGDINMVDLKQVETLMNCGVENINR